MIVYGIDPGTTQSAICSFDGVQCGKGMTITNDDLLSLISGHSRATQFGVFVFEQVESFGMAVGKEVFETVFWTGRFYEAVKLAEHRDRLVRRVIKLHLCQSPRATDANIRQAIIDRFGATKEIAIGNKKQPGPLYGIKGHEFAALAVALTWWDQHIAKKEAF